MSVETYIDHARTRVRVERDAADAKADAYDAFVDRVADVPGTSTSSTAPRATATAGALSRGGSSTDDRCRAVRNAFAETVRPHSTDDVDDHEPLLEAVRAELSESIAFALAPTTEPSFSPGLKRAVVSVAGTRRTESRVLSRALAREDARLERAGDLVEDVTDWISRADESPLSDLGFEALERRHETLAGHRDRCADLADQRQAFLQGTTNEGVDVGIRHRQLVSSLYGDFPVDFPVLATVTRLDATCEACQRAVRQHLVRRA
jgi:hypothetical protein